MVLMKSAAASALRPTHLNRRSLLSAALLALALGITGCGKESASPTSSGSSASPASPTSPAVASISGEFKLVKVNGKPVPSSISHDGNELQVRSGSFTFKADGTCASRTTFVPPNGAEATREVTATYQAEGSKLTMQWNGAGTTTGTLKGNEFSMNNEGMVLEYRK